MNSKIQNAIEIEMEKHVEAKRAVSSSYRILLCTSLNGDLGPPIAVCKSKKQIERVCYFNYKSSIDD